MDPYLGEIRIFAGDYAPFGWMICQGQLLPISGNEALYSLLGTAYGGDGRNNFALPDFRSRVPVGMNSDFPFGTKGGFEAVTLLQENHPTHTHICQVRCLDGGDSGSPKQDVPGTAFDSKGKAANRYTSPDGKTLLTLASESISVSAAGASIPHANVQPSIALNFIISIDGIYPQRE